MPSIYTQYVDTLKAYIASSATDRRVATADQVIDTTEDEQRALR